MNYNQYLQKLLFEANRQELLDISNRGQNLFTPKSIKYAGISPKSKTIYFKTGKYLQKIRLSEYRQISRLRGDYDEKLELAVNDEIKVYCSCPDFLYSGQQYMAWNLDYGIHKEMRPPDIRNPKLDGSICKHLYYLLNNIDTYIPKIAKDFYDSRVDRKIRKKKIKFNSVDPNLKF